MAHAPGVQVIADDADELVEDVCRTRGREGHRVVRERDVGARALLWTSA